VIMEMSQRQMGRIRMM